MSEDSIKLTSTTPFASPGVDDDEFNPLNRAVEVLVDRGRPIAALHHSYFRALPLEPSLRWLGCFVFSAGKRLVFFPGFDVAYSSTLVTKGGNGVQEKEFQTDHLSLEPDRRTWHLTMRGSSGHVGPFPTMNLGEGRVFWFGLSIPEPAVMRIVRTSTVINARVPSSDSHRRMQSLMKAVEGVAFNELLLNTAAHKLFIPGFLHFSIVVGDCNFKSPADLRLGFPIGSPYFEKPLDLSGDLPIRRHRIKLEPYVDFEITTAHLPGKLLVPATFTSPT